VKAFDIKDGGKEVAIKISRNKKFDFDNGKVEYGILKTIKELDTKGSAGVVKVQDCFPFRNHMVLVFEFLGQNLYKYLKTAPSQSYQRASPFSMPQLKSVTLQLLKTLHFLKDVAGVIHCDLKPENILFTSEKCDQVKIIDFGSSCFHYKSGFTYV